MCFYNLVVRATQTRGHSSMNINEVTVTKMAAPCA